MYASIKVMVDLLPVRSHLGIDTFCFPRQRCAGGAIANVFVNSVYTNNVLNARVHVTLVILRAKFHDLSSLLSVLKIVILMLYK